MPEELWNKDIYNVFGLLRSGMYLNGTWPLLRKSFSANVRWAFGFLLMIVIHINLSIDIIVNRAGTNKVAEALFLWAYTTVFETKHVCLYLHAKLLEENVNSAIQDWWHSEQNEECRIIMKKYSRHQSKFTTYMAFIVVASSVIYWTTLYLIILSNKPTDYQGANDTDNDDPIPKDRVYLIPSSWLDDKISSAGYILLCVLHMIWDLEMILDESWSTSFYYTIVMHLAGQFEILGNEFRQFGCGIKTESALRRVLGTLVRRHYKLIKLADNLRVSFAEIIFVQLGLCATIIAVLGLRAMMDIKHGNYLELLKSIIATSYVLLVTGIYIYTADFLSLQSESIFCIVNEIPWYEFPRNIVKDFIFLMVRSEKPIRLSGGKFFYVSRSTLMYIINTAVSYISVLNATVQT